MVSLYKALTKSQPSEEFEISTMKRKWEEPFAKEFFKDHIKLDDKRKSTFVNPQLEIQNPFASDKYFSIQSGQIQLCNTKGTAEDSKRSHQTPPDHMSLDLELNLTCESQRKIEDSSYDGVNKKHNYGSPKSLTESSKCMKDLNGSASWLSSEGDYKEMVATVCMRCHMLIMLCKSSPSCPNCKFVHPPDQNPPSKFLKGRSTFFCSS